MWQRFDAWARESLRAAGKLMRYSQEIQLRDAKRAALSAEIEHEVGLSEGAARVGR